MENLSFTLNPIDIEKISDALTEMDDTMELVTIFSLLEMQDKSIKITVIEDTEEVFELSELLEDLGLESNKVCGGNCTCHDDDDEDDDINFDEENPSDYVVTAKVEVDPKIKMMQHDENVATLYQDPNPIATPIVEDDDDFLTEYDVQADSETKVEEPDKREVYGWDSRIPPLSPDLTKPEVVDSINETLANEPPTPINPVPKPKQEEPDLDRDDVCPHCGGFTINNPHSDPKMNCDCVEEAPKPKPTPAPKAWNTNVWST